MDENILEESLDGNFINTNNDSYGWSTFKVDDINNDGVDEIVAENYHDGTYNGLRLIDSKWKKTILVYGK